MIEGVTGNRSVISGQSATFLLGPAPVHSRLLHVAVAITSEGTTNQQVRLGLVHLFTDQVNAASLRQGVPLIVNSGTFVNTDIPALTLEPDVRSALFFRFPPRIHPFSQPLWLGVSIDTDGGGSVSNYLVAYKWRLPDPDDPNANSLRPS